ncbi:hypothetical protein J5N97_004201 [Dioscorea zingiberensis]|uniref:Uncharacterized protein n=1 Tax=Dioscorea zingiberensis TaxID=325984 RepID=A0A9D5HQR5_9LILI|nr:hypothetical protein J5N97_004201 [Dioscorea zingiberensis]
MVILVGGRGRDRVRSEELDGIGGGDTTKELVEEGLAIGEGNDRDATEVGGLEVVSVLELAMAEEVDKGFKGVEIPLLGVVDDLLSAGEGVVSGNTELGTDVDDLLKFPAGNEVAQCQEPSFPTRQEPYANPFLLQRRSSIPSSSIIFINLDGELFQTTTQTLSFSGTVSVLPSLPVGSLSFFDRDYVLFSSLLALLRSCRWSTPTTSSPSSSSFLCTRHLRSRHGLEI